VLAAGTCEKRDRKENKAQKEEFFHDGYYLIGFDGRARQFPSPDFRGGTMRDVAFIHS
jgi:hypothetical protein